MSNATKGIIIFVAAVVLFVIGYSFGQNSQTEAPEMAEKETMVMEHDSHDHDHDIEDAVAYAVDSEASELAWVAGYAIKNDHNGTVPVQSGEILFDDEHGVVGGNFVIDMTNITTLDIESPEFQDKFITHIASDDFFSVEAHPTASFEITNTEVTTKSNDVFGMIVRGNLTIKGIANSVEFPAKVTFTEDMLTAEATLTIDRTLWDIQFGSDKFFDNLGDNVIKDEINYTITVVAKR